MKDRIINNRGFTLIELIAVLVLITVVSAVAMSRVTGMNEARLVSEIDTLKGHLRYAQSLAFNDIQPFQWGINISGTAYTLVRFDSVNSTTTNPLNLPNESSFTHSFTGSITASVTGTNPVLFNEWGNPGSTATTISIGGETITITANTGFIP